MCLHILANDSFRISVKFTIYRLLYSEVSWIVFPLPSVCPVVTFYPRSHETLLQSFVIQLVSYLTLSTWCFEFALKRYDRKRVRATHVWYNINNSTIIQNIKRSRNNNDRKARLVKANHPEDRLQQDVSIFVERIRKNWERLRCSLIFKLNALNAACNVNNRAFPSAVPSWESHAARTMA